MALKTSDINPRIATRILNDKADLLSGVHAAEIRNLLERRGVLVFPEVNFTDEEQVALHAKHWASWRPRWRARRFTR